MKVSSRFRKLITSLFIVAIGWMFVGILVNFHQHQVFGKRLIYQIQPIYVSKTGKSVLDYKQDGQQELLPGFVAAFNNLTSMTGIIALPLYFEKSFYEVVYQSQPVIFEISQRGPPIFRL
ncbi:MAG: hypothetical protein K9J27_10420 [Bacteroidales bacterium]|nr:hypothetical protein [Bacteroidales bacterium]MCF8334268.1 hypothetical protein [Bacteroidales bacterium]